MCVLSKSYRFGFSVILISSASVLASCASKKAVEQIEPTDVRVVRSYAPVKQTQPELVSDLLEEEQDVEPTITTIQNSDPLLNGTIDAQTQSDGVTVVLSTDEEIEEPVSEDDAEAIKKLVTITEEVEEGLCIVTVDNDCSVEAIEPKTGISTDVSNDDNVEAVIEPQASVVNPLKDADTKTATN